MVRSRTLSIDVILAARGRNSARNWETPDCFPKDRKIAFRVNRHNLERVCDNRIIRKLVPVRRQIMGKSLHNRIYLGRSSVLGERRWQLVLALGLLVGTAVALAALRGWH
jgi:hypothetical protein